MFYRIPYCIGLLESTFRVIVNRSRVYPPLAGLPAVFVEGLPAVFVEGLPAVFLVRRFFGGVADWRVYPPLAGLPAVFVAGWNEIFGEQVICQE